MLVSFYPVYPVHEMGKFTHFVYGMFWVNSDHHIALRKKGEELVTGKQRKTHTSHICFSGFER